MAYIQQSNIIQSQNTKFIKKYTFITSSSSVIILDDFDTLLYIIDLTTDDIIYNPLSKGKGGSVFNNVVTLDYDMTNLNDSDNLLIVVDYKETDTSKEVNQNIIEELKFQTKLLIELNT